MKKFQHLSLLQRFFALFFAFVFFCSSLTIIPTPNSAYAVEEGTAETALTPEPASENPDKNTENNEKNAEKDDKDSEEAENICSDQSGAIGWIVCPGTGFIAKAIDTIYDVIEQFLIIAPLESDDNSAIHLVWEYARNLTNIVFIIFLLVVIYSQLTGIGISNYGIKRVLPRIIIAAILVNLSYVICQLAVDVSNILGFSLRGFFTSIQETAIANGAVPTVEVTWNDLANVITGGALLATLGITTFAGGLVALFWTLIPVLLGGLVAIGIGFITISMRQALVTLLVMISPLAFVCFLLPNTEKWFEKWKKTLSSMIIFYPAFSFLFGASQLAGWAILCSATSAFGVVLGLAVQVFPLFFSWSLMKMSGTILGTINQKLNSVASKPLSTFSGYAASKNAMKRAEFLTKSNTIGANARRYLDYRSGLRKTYTAHLQNAYTDDLATRIQKKMNSNYDPGDSEKPLKSNKYIRAAKSASNSSLRAKTAAADTAHVLDKYSSYYKGNMTDAGLSSAATKGWIDYNRANFTTIADEEADFDYLVGKYIDMNELGPGNQLYEKYIKSVSPDGKFNVMGQLINKAAAVEQRRRRDYNTMIAKWNFDKRNFRNMAIGYLNNDDGLAVDMNGNKLEEQPGYLLKNDPSKLFIYDQKDENGRLYFDWYDQDKFVMRVYRDDSAFMKEAFSNFDTIINDPENALYGILSGIEEGEIKGDNEEESARYKNIGLSKYATTLGRAILSAGYKEKNAAFSPYMAEMIKQRRIKTTGQMNIAMLDSLLKGAKAGNFVTQDQFSIGQYAYMLDPDNFAVCFPDADIDSYENVNGKPLSGIDENGNKVESGKATLEDKKRKLQQDYLMKAMNMMAQMMTKDTPNIRENQKTSAVERLQQLKKSIDKWTNIAPDDYSILMKGVKTRNPYETAASTYSQMAKDISQEIKNNSNNNSDVAAQTFSYSTEFESIRNLANDSIDFFNNVSEFCSGKAELNGVLSQFTDYHILHPEASIEDHYEELLTLLRYFSIDD